MDHPHAVWALIADQPRLESALARLWESGLAPAEVSLLGSYESLPGFGQSIWGAKPRRGAKRAVKKSPFQWLERKGVIDVPGAGPFVATGRLLTALLHPDSESALQRIVDSVRNRLPVRNGGSNDRRLIPGILLALQSDEGERLARASGALEEVSDNVFPGDALLDDTDFCASPFDARAEDFEPYSDLYNGTVAQVMDRDVQYVGYDTPLSEALCAMRRMDAEFLPVIANGRMVGLVTNSDVPARHAPANHQRPTQVSDAMIQDFLYCFDDNAIAEVAAIMEQNQVKRIPVLNRSGMLVGMIRSTQSLDARVYEPHLTD